VNGQLDKLSNEELLKIAGISLPAPTDTIPKDLSSLSNEELIKIANLPLETKQKIPIEVITKAAPKVTAPKWMRGVPSPKAMLAETMRGIEPTVVPEQVEARKLIKKPFAEKLLDIIPLEPSDEKVKQIVSSAPLLAFTGFSLEKQKYIYGGIRKVVETVVGFSSPEMIAALGIGALVPGAAPFVSAYFTAEIAKSLPEQTKVLREALKGDDPIEIGSAVASFGISALFLTGLVKGGLKMEKPSIAKKPVEIKPKIEKPLPEIKKEIPVEKKELVKIDVLGNKTIEEIVNSKIFWEMGHEDVLRFKNRKLNSLSKNEINDLMGHIESGELSGNAAIKFASRNADIKITDWREKEVKPIEEKPPEVPVEKPPEAELKIPEVGKPYPTTAMFDTKDVRTGETIKANESVWFYPELGGVVKESTHRKLFQKIQEPGKILKKEEFIIKEKPRKQKEIFKKPTIFKEYKKYERDIDIIRSEVERGEPGKKVISGGRMINGVERVVTWQPSTYPKYFKDKRYTKKETLNIIDKIKAGKPITEIQTTIINDLIKSKREIDTRIILEERAKRPVIIEEPPLVKPPEPIQMHAGLSAIMPEIVQKKLNQVAKLFKPPEGIAKQSWNIIKDYWGKREGLTFKHSDRWKRELKDKFTKPELEDAIFYRQKTGNIWRKKGDTFDAVSERMPDRLKKFVDGEINEHIKNMRKWYNEAPFTKDIIAREEVIKTYLTGVYSGNIKKGYDYLVGLKGRQFVTNNFMRNRKTYITFAEAFEKAGLIPKFRNIADQLNYQDAYMIKLYTNNELISNIHKLEKEIKQKLVVRTNSKLYDEAKLLKDSEGKNLYVKFEDPYLRSYVAGIGKDGKPIWATSRAPALVHRDLGGAIQSVFSKDAYKPENIWWRTYDRAGSFLRYIRVTFSGFHFVPLAESLVGGKGTSVLNVPQWINHGKKLLNDPTFMTEVKEARLRIKAPSEASRGQVEGRIKDLVNRLEAQGKGKKALGKTIKVVTAPQLRLTKFLFDEYLPLLKTQMYYSYKSSELARVENKNIRVNSPQMKELNRKVASTVNDQFGGQAWEMIRYLNDPKVMKWMHRAVGYPDWSISALRQAGAIGEAGIRGHLARRYWLRYGIAFMATQQAISYLNTGLYNDEKGNIKWSWDRAHSTFENIDPSLKHKIDFQLPDIKINLPIVGEFNPGRELKADGTYGRRYYSHFGKQMLEIPRYVLKPIDQLFAKSNPVIQMIFKQVAGGAPYEGGIFPARGGYTVTGEFKAWKGKEGLEQFKERGIQLIQDATPFSIQSMWTTSPATAGVLPISKATSKFAAQKYIEKAIRDNKPNELLLIVQSLLDSGYSPSSIERDITTISNALLRKGFLEDMLKKK